MHSPESGGQPPGSDIEKTDLTPEEEEDIVDRIAKFQETVVSAALEWTSKVHGDRPIPAADVFTYVMKSGTRWEEFTCGLLGVSAERFKNILAKKGYR